MKPRTLEERKQIIALHTSGKNKSQIARETGIPRATIRDIIKNYREFDTLEPRYGGVKGERYAADIKEFFRWACDLVDIEWTNPFHKTVYVRRRSVPLIEPHIGHKTFTDERRFLVEE